jgi:hypothetical protein
MIDDEDAEVERELERARQDQLRWMRVRPNVTTRVLKLESLAETLSLPPPHSMLFVASDFRSVADETARDFVRRCIDDGAVWIHFWGPDAERMYDRFCDVRAEIDPLEEDEDGYLMVTAHDDHFADRFWYFLFATRPPVKYIETCRSRVAVAVGAPKWFSEMHRYLAEPHVLDEVTSRNLIDGTGPFSPPTEPDEDGPSV